MVENLENTSIDEKAKNNMSEFDELANIDNENNSELNYIMQEDNEKETDKSDTSEKEGSALDENTPMLVEKANH